MYLLVVWLRVEFNLQWFQLSPKKKIQVKVYSVLKYTSEGLL